MGGRGHAIAVAVRTHAAASAGLIIIATIPHGHLPDHVRGWLVVPVVGAVVGAVCGVVIGAVCGGAAPVGISDVMALARTPSHALRQLLDPDDLVKLGARMRSRTRTMFQGMFEPLDGPPDKPPRRAHRRRAPRRQAPRPTSPPTPPSPKAVTCGPSYGRLALALIASLLLWNLPFGGVVLYPFKLLATWLHEMSHGLVMIVTGAGFDHVADLSRHQRAVVRGVEASGRSAPPSIAAAGYMGTPLWGAVLLVATPTARSARWALVAIGALLLVTAVIAIVPTPEEGAFGQWAIGGIAVGARGLRRSCCPRAGA